jgi:hypothetical protein
LFPHRFVLNFSFSSRFVCFGRMVFCVKRSMTVTLKVPIWLISRQCLSGLGLRLCCAVFRSGMNFNYNHQDCSSSVVLAFTAPKLLWVVSRLWILIWPHGTFMLILLLSAACASQVDAKKKIKRVIDHMIGWEVVIIQ